MELYVFNPDADLALADNEENYMAPAAARGMAQDLALLPVWYARPGSAVLAASAYNADFLKRMQQVFSLQVQQITEPELPDYAEAQVIPWGWNPSFRKRMLKSGIAEHALPSASSLQTYRELSSRKRALEVLDTFQGMEACCGKCDCLQDLDACRERVEQHGNYVFKAPWSGSGKGLLWCYGHFPKSAANWCGHVLKEQGCLIGSAIYNKVEDFAMEFYSDGQGTVRFAGYSLFTTNGKGAYLGNVLLPDNAIEQQLAEYVPLSALTQIREHLQSRLTALYGTLYTGYLGVDMMICKCAGDAGYAVHPCVEINLRMNMGVVARLFYDRFVAAGSTGHFFVEYYSSNEELQAKHAQDSMNTLVVEGGRLVSGYIPLVPVTKNSAYRVYALLLPCTRCHLEQHKMPS
ncbi:hypothetical protein AAE250_15800 [Bacteroides sp. GD17]|jgi:hypothetical protein|uniref:hypothetical protein n=1 Tax=Bacteroides sp. GD17 TaxID=3139826 RepID=UPI0025CCBB2F|nr:hypothetical protein [uncultured Bacteroides sp.]